MILVIDVMLLVVIAMLCLTNNENNNTDIHNNDNSNSDNNDNTHNNNKVPGKRVAGPAEPQKELKEQVIHTVRNNHIKQQIQHLNKQRNTQ